MKINSIVLDLDGTILHGDKTISDYTRLVLKKCKEKGIRIVVATARSEKAAEKYTKAICPDTIISNGGSLVKSKENTIFECKLSAKTADAIINELTRQTGFISISAETEKGYYVTWEKADSEDYSHAVHYDFSIPLSQDVYKITAELSSSKGLSQIEAKYSECKMIPFSDGMWYRFAHKSATKMNAINKMAEFYDINRENIVAFGDDYNDIEMICKCGIGVAMKNGIDEVKEIADYICESNDNDGGAKWIERFLL